MARGASGHAQLLHLALFIFHVLRSPDFVVKPCSAGYYTPMSLTDNWPIKLAIVVILAFVGAGAYYAIKAGEHMSLSKQMIPILTEKYRAPTEDAWKKAHAELNIPYTERRRFTTEEMKRYIAKWEADKQQKLSPAAEAPR